MTDRFEKYPIMPEHMRQRTIATMPIDTPYYIDLDSDSAAHWEDGVEIWVDEHTGQLKTLLDGVLDEGDKECTKSDLSEKAAIMRVEILDELGNIHSGLIADLRYTQPGLIEVDNDDEAPDDQEELMQWLKAKDKTINFVAIATKDGPTADDDKSEDVLSGEAIYYDALRYLMQQVDALPDDEVSDDESGDHQASDTVREKVRKIFGKIARKG